MKRLQELTVKILELTSRIERDYPELYKHLNENPITIGKSDTPEVTIKNFSNYLQSLQELLERQIESHENGN